MTKKRLKLSIVIPVYHGQDTIASLYADICTALDGQYDYEVIFVWDCGPDNSWNIICDLKSKYPDTIKAVRLGRNYGQHNALICGFEQCHGDYVITMDEDGQQHPSDIIRLIEKQQSTQCDVVYGYHKRDVTKHSFFRGYTSKIVNRLLRLACPDIHTHYSPFRLILTPVAKSIITMRNSYTFLDGYLAWVTNNVQACEVSHFERTAGHSSYTIKKLIEHAINIFVTFSNLPIRLVMLQGLTALFISILYSIYVLYIKIWGDGFLPGYATLMITFGLGIGMILFSLGILGEYLYRVNLKTTKRPNYLVREIL